MDPMPCRGAAHAELRLVAREAKRCERHADRRERRAVAHQFGYPLVP